jgi:hypothetical protein
VTIAGNSGWMSLKSDPDKLAAAWFSQRYLGFPTLAKHQIRMFNEGYIKVIVWLLLAYSRGISAAVTKSIIICQTNFL